ncbi:MAG: Wzz/FepE/Etk N-terminal domain-containing protein [Clostridium sp.]
MDNNSFFGIKDIKTIIKSRSKTIIACALIGVLLGVGSLYIKFNHEYTANATIVIGKVEGTTNREKNEVVEMYQRLVKSSYVLLKSEVVLTEAKENLGEEFKDIKLEEVVEGDYSANTQFMTISAIDKVPENAKKIVDEVSKVFVTKANEVFENSNIKLVEESKLPLKTQKNPYKTMLIGSILGLIVGVIGGVVISIILEAFDPRIKDERDVSANLNLPVLGFIPRNK